MTICVSWIGTKGDGTQNLYLASDSRNRGGYRIDYAQKTFLLPRSDCAIAYSGDSLLSYQFIAHFQNAILAHGPSRERSMDINFLAKHILQIANSLINDIKESMDDYARYDISFLFCGYSWKKKDFCIWSLNLNQKKIFEIRPAIYFNTSIRKAAFIGDWSSKYRSLLMEYLLNNKVTKVDLEPLRILSNLLNEITTSESIGGAPQIIKISEHMNSRPYCVIWKDKPTLFGRNLFPFENNDYWQIEPFSLSINKPRKYGNRNNQ
jgi:hypothetical protein